MGRMDSTSGRTVAFCLSKPGLNPGTGLAFFVQNCSESILAGHWAFSKERGIEWCIHTFPSSFLVPITTI